MIFSYIFIKSRIVRKDFRSSTTINLVVVLILSVVVAIDARLLVSSSFIASFICCVYTILTNLDLRLYTSFLRSTTYFLKISRISLLIFQFLFHLLKLRLDLYTNFFARRVLISICSRAWRVLFSAYIRVFFARRASISTCIRVSLTRRYISWQSRVYCR